MLIRLVHVIILYRYLGNTDAMEQAKRGYTNY